MKNHREGWNREEQYLKRTFQNQKNAYPRHIIEGWTRRFEQELERNPELLVLRKNRLRLRPEPEPEIHEEPDQEMQEENVVGDLRRSRNVLLIPYVKGVSDQLRNIANRFGIRSWFSFSGKLGNGFSATYKNQLHQSKLRNAVYRAVCTCGRGYIGETERNVKVRLLEHKSTTSTSSLSQHLAITMAHQLDANRTAIVSKEKHVFRRKLLESLFICNTPTAICNRGPSLRLSDMWFTCEPKIRTCVANSQ